VVNGVYGAVAEYEIDNRTKNITSMKKLEQITKPSRGHTRASTMASEQVLGNTLRAGVTMKDCAKDLFKLSKFKNVTSRVGQYHNNDPKYVSNLRKGRQSVNVQASQNLDLQ
jgi:hypothetical protein